MATGFICINLKPGLHEFQTAGILQKAVDKTRVLSFLKMASALSQSKLI